MSYTLSSSLWNAINDFLKTYGQLRDPRDLVIEATKGLSSLIRFDQCKVIFFSKSGKVQDEVIYGIGKCWNELFFEYYADMEISFSGFWTSGVCDERSFGGLCRWGNSSTNKFIDEYIRPQGLTYSLWFNLKDEDGFVRCSCSLDRRLEEDFTKEDLMIIEIIHPHLENLFQNLLIDPSILDISFIEENTQPLTKRETEIADLLRKGLAPQTIARCLNVNTKTVYRHIANIHRKLGVSNRQELIIRLMKPS